MRPRDRGPLATRSRRAQEEQWRRRRRRRRCWQHGEEPCQDKATKPRSPPIPAAGDTVTGPPALPLLGPDLVPIV